MAFLYSNKNSENYGAATWGAIDKKYIRFIKIMYNQSNFRKYDFNKEVISRDTITQQGIYLTRLHVGTSLTCATKIFSYNVLIALLFALAVGMQFLFCVIPSGPSPSKLNMFLESDKRISPFGTINIHFNEPLRDTTVVMQLLPDQIELTALVSPNRVTAQFKFPVSLQGNTRYCVIPQSIITSKNGEELDNSDTLCFITCFKETEHNNSKETADVWKPTMNGMISTTDDKDWYKIEDSLVTGIYRLEYGSRCTFTVVDSTGSVIAGDPLVRIDTLVLPEPLMIPLYIVVESHLRSTDGYYEIGVLYK